MWGMADACDRVVRFAQYILDMRRRELRREPGGTVPLTAKALDTLAVLVSHSGETVDKRTLMTTVWPGRVLEENNLTQAIAALRRAFGTDAHDHSFIVTVPGRGYRFVAQVREITQGAETGTDDRAFRAYLTGRYLINRPDPARLPDALDALRDAIDIDPTFARAYAAMAFAYRALCITGDRAPLDVFPLARAAAAQALTIEPRLAEAHAQKGFIQFWHDWDWAAAESTLRHAIELDPDLAEARLAYAHLLNNLRRFPEAVEQIVRARELEPLSPLITTLEAGFLACAGRLSEARATIERAIELAPGFPPAWLHSGQIAVDRGDIATAVEHLERGHALTSSSQLSTMLGVAYAAAGRRSDAERVLADLDGRAQRGYVPPTSRAAIEAALGRHDRALDLLEEAHALRDVRLTFLAVDSRWNPLRSLPRFTAIVRRMNLPAVASAPG